jgi:mannose/fructose-specific phosphotransferase system component IIA
MPWIKISSETHKDMKQYVLDIEGMNLGLLVEASFTYAMKNLKHFEEFLSLEEEDEESESHEDNEDEEDKEEED